MTCLKSARRNPPRPARLAGILALSLALSPTTARAQDMDALNYVLHAANCSVLVFFDPPEHVSTCRVGGNAFGLTTSLANLGSGTSASVVAPPDPPYVPPYVPPIVSD